MLRLCHERHMADPVRISKTLSYWLRHRPDVAGLALDAQGWASVDAVLSSLAERGLAGDIDTLLAVVEHNDKQRFELAPDLSRIRARQGHSVAVELALTPSDPPDLLFHGTVERCLAAILEQGLRKMRRHHVHLSADVAAAERVGARRGRAIVLEIDATAMRDAGHVFFVTGNGVWLTEAVPPAFLRRRQGALRTG
jgi:putative RNA 2'-phosphotransferase